MTADSKTYGSYGPREDVAGRTQHARKLFASGSKAKQKPFGRRQTAPGKAVSLDIERLSHLYEELRLIYLDLAYPDDPLPFCLEDSDPPKLRIGTSGSVSIDGDTGSYLFIDALECSESALATSSHERVMDFIISHLARTQAETPSSTRLAVVENCVGHTVEDVERALILATLRHCRGNRTHAAAMLSISLRTLRNKLRAYWRAGSDNAA